MAKKVVKVSDNSTPTSNLDVGKLASVVLENKETIGKVADTLGDLFGDDKTTTKKKTTKKSSSKKTTKADDNNILDTIGDLIGSNDTKSSKKTKDSDNLSKVLDIAGDILKNKSSK